MHSEPYCLIHMAIEMAREAGPFFSFVDFMSCITLAKRPCYGPLKIKPSYIIVHYYVISSFVFWQPANSNECRYGYHCRRRVSNCCNLQSGSRNQLISHLQYNFYIKPFDGGLVQPLPKRLPGVGCIYLWKPCHEMGK